MSVPYAQGARREGEVIIMVNENTGSRIHLDTVKLRIPSDGFDIDTSELTHIQQTNRKSGVIDEWYRESPQRMGVKEVRYHPNSQTATVELSAKALLSGYLEGIHAGTVPGLVEAINATDVILTDESSLMRSTVLRADAAENIQVGDTSPYRHALSTIVAKRFRVVQDSNSVTFQQQRKRQSSRLTAYDKQNELSLAANKTFIELAGSKVYEESKGVLRIERRASSYAQLRDMAGQEEGEVSLGGLLATDQKPVHALYTKIRAGAVDVLEMLNNIDVIMEVAATAPKALAALGLHAMAELWGEDVLIAALKNRFGHGAWRQIKAIREMQASRQAGAGPEQQGTTLRLLDEIEQRLAA